MSADIFVRHESGRGAIDSFAADWDRLVRAAAIPHPSSPFAVVRELLAHERGARGTAHVWIAYRDEQPAAALLGVTGKLHWYTEGQLRTPGDHDAYAVPLLVRASDSNAAAEVIRSALCTTPGYIRVCMVRQTNRAFFEAVQGSARDLLFMYFPTGKASFLPVPHSEHELWERLSANFRKNLRKQTKRLEAVDAKEWRFLRGGECSSVEIERFLELEASGWKARAGGAILSRPDAAAYYRDMLSALAREGRLELHQLFVEGRCVAVQVGVRMHDVLCLLKIAYDESSAHLAPGNMLFLELVRREITAGACREIDCLTDMAWHRNWAMHQRETFDIHVYPRTWRGLALGYAPRAIREWARKNGYLKRVRDFLVRRNVKQSVS